jgi:hypothetical protein
MRKTLETKSITEIKAGDVIAFHGAELLALTDSAYHSRFSGWPVFRFLVKRIDENVVRGMNDELSNIESISGFAEKILKIR